MTTWVVVLTAIVSSLASAQPPPSREGEVVSEPAVDAEPESLPSVRVMVRGDGQADEVGFLRGALVLRLLDRGYCVATEQAELSVVVEQRDGRTEVEVAGGAEASSVVSIAGVGAVAALEAIHRADAALARRRDGSMRGEECRRAALPLRIDDDGDEIGAALVRDWVGGLSSAGAALVRGSSTAPDRVCLQHDDEGLAVGRGESCSVVVRLPSREAGDPGQEIERAVGAALAVAEERPVEDGSVEASPSPSVAAPTEDEDDEVVEEPRRPEPPGPVDSADEEPDVDPSDASPVATLHALVGGGLSVRRGGVDGMATAEAGVVLGPGIIVAANVAVIPAALELGVLAVDTDVAGGLGYRLRLAKRSGLRFDALAGARVHTWRTNGGPTSVGQTTWVLGAGLGGWWRIGRDLTLEVAVQQRFSGHQWRHEVGFSVAGDRGRATTMLVAGLGWLGRRRWP